MRKLVIEEVTNGWIVKEYGDDTDMVTYIPMQTRVIAKAPGPGNTEAEKTMALDSVMTTVRVIMNSWESPDRDDPLAP